MKEGWIALSQEKPPIGMCLLVTVHDHYTLEPWHSYQVRYPVYYMERPDKSGYGFYWGSFDNILLRSGSEVISWKLMDEPQIPEDYDAGATHD